MSIERFQFRARLDSAPAEIVTKADGSQALHVPIASLVGDTVLNWYLVPTESVAQTVANWIGKPVTIDHPPVDDEGAVEFLNDQSNIAGVIVDSKIVNGKLIHMAELPYPGDTPAKKAILNALLGGTVMEVSTGYFAWPVEREGEVEGRKFRQVHQDIAPDHLALLPNATGACSVADGCGTLRANAMMTARTPQYNGVETTAAASWSLADYVAAYNAARSAAEESDIAKLSAQAKAWIANHTLLGDPNAATEADLLAYPVVNPATGALNRAALVACLADRRNQAALGKERRANLRAAATELLGKFAAQNADTTATANADLDLEERIRLVSRAIWENWAPKEGDDLNEKPWPYVQKIMDDHAIFEQGSATYRVNYDLTEVDGLWSVALGERQRGAMEFVPAENAGGKLMKWFRRLTGIGTNEGDNTMDRKDLIAKVAAKTGIAVDRAALAFANAQDCELERLLAQNAEAPAPAPAPAAPAPTAPATVTVDAPAATAITAEAIAAAVPQFAEFLRAQNARETQIRNAAKAKAASLGISEDDIASTPVAVLERLMRPPAGDFSGAAAAFGFEHAAGTEEVEFRPQDVAYAGPTVKAKVQ